MGERRHSFPFRTGGTGSGVAYNWEELEEIAADLGAGFHAGPEGGSGPGRSRGIPTRVISYVMAALIAVTIVLSIRIMGIVLLISLLTMPVAIVNSLSRSYRTIALCAPLVAVAGNVAGLVASYNFEVPPGAAIIFTLTLTLIMVKLLPLRQKKAGAAA